MKRFHTVDRLRAYSVLSVVCLHVSLRVPLWPELSQFARSILHRGGNLGVRAFFVVSGFLITQTVIERAGRLSDINVREFYRRRFARIVPLLALLVFVLVLLHALGVKNYVIRPEVATPLRAVVAVAGLHVNWLEAARGYLPGGWDVLWTLSVEEVFYLLFPVLCVLLSSRTLLVTLVLFVLLGPLARTVLTDNDMWRTKGYLACADGLALGCLVALARTRFGAVSRWIGHLGWIVLLSVLCFGPPAAALAKYGLVHTWFSLGVACVLLAPDGKKSWFGPIGQLSYEIYLTHMFVVFAGVHVFRAVAADPRLAPVLYLVACAVSVALGWCVHRWFSEPLNRVLRDMVRSR